VTGIGNLENSTNEFRKFFFVNPFNASCSKLLPFERFSAILV